MNSGGHVGLGILFYIITAQLLNTSITPEGILLAAFFSLLPDVDVVLSYFLNIKHREITHSLPVALLLVTVTAVFSPPLAASLASHYAADYVYPQLMKRFIPLPPANPVSHAEFYSAALLGFSIFYSLLLILVNSKPLTITSAVIVILTILAGACKKEK